MKLLPMALLALVAGGQAAAATPTSNTGAPPDVIHGERYDGRKKPPTSARKSLLVVPRILLAVPYLVVKGLAAVARPAMEWSERDRLPQWVNEALSSNDGHVGVRPYLQYELEFKPLVGATYFNHRLPHGARLKLTTGVGGPNDVLQEGEVKVPLTKTRLAMSFLARYYRSDDEIYTGIGMRNHLPFARYGMDQADAWVGLALLAKQGLRLVVSADLGARRFRNGVPYKGDHTIADVYCDRIGNGPCFVPQMDRKLVPGFADGTQFVRESVEVHIDSRKNEVAAGLLVDAAVRYTHGFAGDASSYLQLEAHAGTSFEVWRRRTLYVGITGIDQLAFGKTPVPFSELPQLGGVDDLRGFLRGRFRDASSLLGTVEYRWPVWMWMDGSLFVDYGGVFGPQFHGLALADLRPDIGIGLRMRTSKKFLIRLQLAYGFGDRGGFRLVIAANGNPS